VTGSGIEQRGCFLQVCGGAEAGWIEPPHITHPGPPHHIADKPVELLEAECNAWSQDDFVALVQVVVEEVESFATDGLQLPQRPHPDDLIDLCNQLVRFGTSWLRQGGLLEEVVVCAR
jgi:hypothetical protein